jgi:hypothetical protein
LKPDKRAYTSIVPDIIRPVATTTKLKHPPECPGINTNAIWQSSRQRGTPTVVYPFAMEFFHICIYSCTHGQIFPCWGSIIGSAFVSKSAKSKLKLQEEKPSLAWKICDSKLRSYASITWAKIDSEQREFQTEIPWLLIFATSLDKAFLSCFASDARLETCNPNHPIYASLNALITEQRKIKQKKKFNKIWFCLHSVQNSL